MKFKKYLSLILSVIILITSTMTISISAFADDDMEIASIEMVDEINEKRLVFYPSDMESTNTKRPVIVWANGTGCKPSLYESLHRDFAKEGYILVASYETMAADGKDQINSANFIINESKNSSSIFYNKVDTSKIIAMGHSQGGRSTVNSASADNRFCCAVSIAGSNYDYEAEMLSTPTLFFTGTNDKIVSSSKWVKPAYDICKGPAVYASLIDANHTACCTNTTPYVYYSTKWIDAWANNDTNARNVFLPNGELSKDTEWQDYARRNFGSFDGSVSISAKEYTYNGKVRKPAVTVKNASGIKLPSKAYTVSYSKGCKNVGTYTVNITLKGAYTGTVKKTYKINPKNTSDLKVTKAKKGIKASWKKQTTQTTGYQIRYSTSSKMTKAKQATIKSNKKTSYTFSKLSNKKRYYFQIRTYKTVNGKSYYSSWSKAKKFG